jgi:hypothetical protein
MIPLGESPLGRTSNATAVELPSKPAPPRLKAAESSKVLAACVQRPARRSLAPGGDSALAQGETGETLGASIEPRVPFSISV